MKYYPGDYVMVRSWKEEDVVGVVKEGFCYGMDHAVYYRKNRRIQKHNEFYDIKVDYGSLFCHGTDIIRKLTKDEVAVYKLEGKI